MFKEELKRLQTGPRELRKFGLLVGGVFCLLALWSLWRGKAHWIWFLIPGVPLVVLGAVFPAVLRRVYIGWMALAFVLGLVMSTILLTVFFYLVVTPIALCARLAGKDFLSRKAAANA